MNAHSETSTGEPIVSAPFFLRGELVEGTDVIQKSRDLGVTFATPNIPFDKAVPPRSEVPPLLNVPTSEIIDFLVETGQRLVAPDNAYVHECFDRMAATHILPRSVFEKAMEVILEEHDRRTRMEEARGPTPRRRRTDH